MQKSILKGRTRDFQSFFQLLTKAVSARLFSSVAFESIQVEQKDAVKLIRLDRLAKFNALSSQCCEELLQSLKDSDVDDDIHVTVLTGNGKAMSGLRSHHAMSQCRSFVLELISKK